MIALSCVIERQKKFLQFVVLAFSIVLAGWLFFDPIFEPKTHYWGRFLNTIFPWALSLIMIALLAWKKEYLLNRLSVWKFTKYFAMAVFIFHFAALMGWNSYRLTFIKDLSVKRGHYQYIDSLVSKKIGGDKIGQYNWGWTMPTMSVVLSATHLGEVRAIIENENTKVGQPFDPYASQELPQISVIPIPYKF